MRARALCLVPRYKLYQRTSQRETYYQYQPRQRFHLPTTDLAALRALSTLPRQPFSPPGPHLTIIGMMFHGCFRRATSYAPPEERPDGRMPPGDCFAVRRRRTKFMRREQVRDAAWPLSFRAPASRKSPEVTDKRLVKSKRIAVSLGTRLPR